MSSEPTPVRPTDGVHCRSRENLISRSRANKRFPQFTGPFKRLILFSVNLTSKLCIVDLAGRAVNYSDAKTEKTKK